MDISYKLSALTSLPADPSFTPNTLFGASKKVSAAQLPATLRQTLDNTWANWR